jgi:hypothetical protein
VKKQGYTSTKSMKNTPLPAVAKPGAKPKGKKGRKKK